MPTPTPTLKSHPLNVGLRSWYLCADAVGTGSTWRDILGERDATLQTPTWGSTTREGGYGELRTPRGSAAWPKPTTGFTLAMWVYPDVDQADGTSIIQSDSAIVRTIDVGGEPNHVIFYIFQALDMAPFYLISFVALPAGLWTRIYCRYDGFKMEFLYNNAVLDPNHRDIMGSITPAADYFAIGHDGGFGRGFVGAVDGLKIWDRALSTGEVGDEFASGLAGDVDLLNFPAVGPPTGGFLTIGNAAGGFLALRQNR